MHGHSLTTCLAPPVGSTLIGSWRMVASHLDSNLPIKDRKAIRYLRLLLVFHHHNTIAPTTLISCLPSYEPLIAIHTQYFANPGGVTQDSTINYYPSKTDHRQTRPCAPSVRRRFFVGRVTILSGATIRTFKQAVVYETHSEVHLQASGRDPSITTPHRHIP